MSACFHTSGLCRSGFNVIYLLGCSHKIAPDNVSFPFDKGQSPDMNGWFNGQRHTLPWGNIRLHL